MRLDCGEAGSACVDVVSHPQQEGFVHWRSEPGGPSSLLQAGLGDFFAVHFNRIMRLKRLAKLWQNRAVGLCVLSLTIPSVAQKRSAEPSRGGQWWRPSRSRNSRPELIADDASEQGG